MVNYDGTILGVTPAGTRKDMVKTGSMYSVSSWCQSLLASVSFSGLSLARSGTMVKVWSNLTRVLGVIPGTVSISGRTARWFYSLASIGLYWGSEIVASAISCMKLPRFVGTRRREFSFLGF